MWKTLESWLMASIDYIYKCVLLILDIDECRQSRVSFKESVGRETGLFASCISVHLRFWHDARGSLEGPCLSVYVSRI